MVAVSLVASIAAYAQEWAARPASTTARQELAAVVLGGAVVAIGGFVGDRRTLASVESWSPGDPAWTLLPPLPVAVHHPVGWRSDVALAVPEVYVPERDRWSAAAPLPTGRSGHAVAVLDGCLYALGGEGNLRARDGMFDAVERFDRTAGKWTRLPPMALPRHGAGVVELDGALVVAGGAVVAGFGAVPDVDALVPRPCS